MLSVIISKEIVEAGTWNAGQLIREGQTYPGWRRRPAILCHCRRQNPQGLDQALDLARQQLGPQA